MKRLRREVLDQIVNLCCLGEKAEHIDYVMDQLSHNLNVPVPEGFKLPPDFLSKEYLKSLIGPFREMGLRVSAETLEDMIQEEIFGRDQNRTIPELAATIRRELRAVHLMVVPTDKLSLLSETGPLSGAARERFSEIPDEVDEARRCLAFGQDAAAAFHMMRVIEAVVKWLVKELWGIDFLPSWEALLKKIDEATAELESRKKEPGIPQRIRFLQELRIDVKSVSVAWRTELIHTIKKHWTYPQARQVYDKALTLVEHLATY